MSDAEPWPTAIDADREQRQLVVSYNNGETYALSFELLRVESPSAEVQGHVPNQKITVTGKRHVQITNIEPVGNYAIRIMFDDGHNSGIYSWRTLREMGANQKEIWQNYLAALAKKGGQR